LRLNYSLDGTNIISGGTGVDTIDYSGSKAIIVDLSNVTATQDIYGDSSALDKISLIENAKVLFQILF
jgi:hypothetical protein